MGLYRETIPLVYSDIWRYIKYCLENPLCFAPVRQIPLTLSAI